MVANSIGECEALSVNNEEAEEATVSTSDEIDVEINSEANTTPQQIKKGSKARKLKRRLDDTPNNSDDGSASCSDSDSSPEIYRVRPTRSGRQPKKAKKLQAPDINMLNIPNAVSDDVDNDVNESSVIDNSGETVIPSHVTVEVTEVVNTPTEDGKSVETSCPENIANVIPNINQMEPGSLVIVSKESTEEPGNTILQVYMVSPNVDNIANAAIEPNESATVAQELLTNKPETAKSIDIGNISEK